MIKCKRCNKKIYAGDAVAPCYDCYEIDICLDCSTLIIDENDIPKRICSICLEIRNKDK